MGGLKKLIINHLKQFGTLGILMVLVLSGLGLLLYSKGSHFQRFIGEIHPLIAMGSSVILGFISLSFLLSKKWFTIHKKYPIKKVFPYAGLTVFFALVAILIDINIVYPADMNIPFPESLLFYPIIAFLVEIIFHVVPMTLLLVTSTFIFKRSVYDRIVLPYILIVALVEPTYQVVFMESYTTWATGSVWVNLFFFNITQLYTFKRYGFISMYALRLLYYLIWHVVWGVLRLELLF